MRERYAFEVSDAELTLDFGPIKAKGLRYGSAPGPHL